MRTNNPVRDYERYSSDLAEQESELPVCDYCKEPIQDEYYYCIDDRNICLGCLRDYKVVVV